MVTTQRKRIDILTMLLYVQVQSSSARNSVPFGKSFIW